MKLPFNSTICVPQISQLVYLSRVRVHRLSRNHLFLLHAIFCIIVGHSSACKVYEGVGGGCIFFWPRRQIGNKLTYTRQCCWRCEHRYDKYWSMRRIEIAWLQHSYVGKYSYHANYAPMLLKAITNFVFNLKVKCVAWCNIGANIGLRRTHFVVAFVVT